MHCLQQRYGYSNMPTILLIEDEKPIREMVQFVLGQVGFEIIEAQNAQQAYQVLRVRTPDLILLDLMLPGTNGLEITKKLKSQADTKYIPIIMLTARAEEDNKVTALSIGVDDYVVKPFSPRELIARINAVLRRGVLVSPQGEIQAGNLCMTTDSHSIRINGNTVKLTRKEYKLLHFFLTHQRRVCTRGQILNHLWGSTMDVNERTVDVQIGRLRKSLSEHDCTVVIRSVRGMGYQLVELDDA